MVPTAACMLTLALGLTPMAQDESGPVVSGPLGSKLDDYLTRCEAFGFAGTALVEKDGAIVLAKGYGLAERETGRANAVDTIHDIGSLTKQFTAAAVLRLEQEKKLESSDALTKYFDDVPTDKSKITLHHLLTHTSGLPRAISTVGSELHDRAEMIRTVLAAPLESKPGSRYGYSNVGYDLLGAVVEIAAERPFEEYLHESLFAPAGMTSTGFRKDGKLPASRAARGYQSWWQPDLPGSKSRGESAPPWDPSLATEGWYSWGLRGAGGVLTSVSDLRRWQQALDGEAILDGASKKKLFRPFLDNYAYGWYVSKTDRGDPWIEHGGTTNNGFDCKFTRFPDRGLLLIVLGNVTGGIVPWVNTHLGKLAHGDEAAWPPTIAKLEPERASRLEGTYEASSGARVALSNESGQLVLDVTNAEALAWLHPPPPGCDAIRAKSEEIARSLSEGDFGPVHAAEDPAQPLFFFDRWWEDQRKTHGEVVEVRALGVLREPVQGTFALLDVVYEKGREILRLGWNGTTLVSTMTGPPYPSRVALQPTSDVELADFDLLRSQMLVQLRHGKISSRDVDRIELVAHGKELVLERTKD